MSYTIGPRQRTAEWYALRSNPDDPRFGATAAAALLGVSKWQTPRHVYESFFREPIADNDAMRRGRHLEPAVQAMWAEEHGKLVLNDLPMLLDTESPIFASLDSLVCGDMVSGAVEPFLNLVPIQDVDAILEVKTSMSRDVADELGDDHSDNVPTDWLCQVQQQMAVSRLEIASVAVLIFGRLRTFHVERNSTICEVIRERADEMRTRVLHRDPPPLDFEHRHTAELIRSMRCEEGKTVELPPELSTLWKFRHQITAEIKDRELLKENYKARVEAWLIENGASAGLLPDGKKIVRRSVTRKGYTVGEKTYVEMREVKA